MRSCRICLRTDVLHDMINCFENFEIIMELSFLANISIVEIENDKAIICKRCVKNLKQAVEFKKMCIESDLNFKKTSNEHYEWFNNLRILKTTAVEVPEPETKEICHQSPMISDERFQNFLEDAVNLINDTMQNETGQQNIDDNDQFSQIDPDERRNDQQIEINERRNDPQAEINEQKPDLDIIIDQLTEKQLKEITTEISHLLQQCNQDQVVERSSDLLNGDAAKRTRFKRAINNVTEISLGNSKIMRINYKYK